MRIEIREDPFHITITAENDAERRTLSLAGPTPYLTKVSTPDALHISSVSVVQRVGEYMRRAEGEEVSPSEIAAALGVPRVRVSTALDTMKEANLVEHCRHGSWRWKGGR